MTQGIPMWDCGHLEHVLPPDMCCHPTLYSPPPLLSQAASTRQSPPCPPLRLSDCLEHAWHWGRPSATLSRSWQPRYAGSRVCMHVRRRRGVLMTGRMRMSQVRVRVHHFFSDCMPPGCHLPCHSSEHPRAGGPAAACGALSAAC